MEIKLYLKMLQKGWLIILFVILAAVASSLVISYLTVPVYSATARFIITPSTSLTTSNEVISSLNMLDRASVVATYVEVMNSNKILEDSLGLLGKNTQSIPGYTVQAVALPNSSVLELTVTGTNPQLVAELANAIGQQTIAFASSINFILSINFLDAATQPVLPVSPQPLRDAGVTFVLALFGGAFLAIVSEQVRIPLDAYRQRLQLDNVTGVYTAKFFKKSVENKCEDAVDGQLSIGIIELSGLKDLADTLPPSGIQFLLTRVTSILQRELRGNDIIGRWNDTSFIVMLPTTPSTAAKRTYDRIYNILSQEIPLEAYNAVIHLDPHIGGAVFSTSTTANDLFVKAESSLSQAILEKETPVCLWEMKSPFWVDQAAK